MSKRLWSDANGSPTSPVAARRPRVSPAGRVGSDERSARDDDDNDDGVAGQPSAPQISRKVKACASCRKQKIKCLMDDRGPPCRRCSERNLSCVLNKSLQTLIDEKSHIAEAYSHDLQMMYAGLQGVLSRLEMPQMAPLQSSPSSSSAGLTGRDPLLMSPSSTDPAPPRQQQQKSGPSCDNSPRVGPADEGLPHVPIQSLYRLTKISALRSPGADEVQRRPDRLGMPLPPLSSSSLPPASEAAATAAVPVDDFISRGAISLPRAERLFRLYADRLDPFMYRIGCRYATLAEVRRKSPILTASICTVAALHDPQSDDVYGVCSHELRRLTAASMFDRLVGLDSLRAMCVAAYWLSDVSWTMSGYAIRRAGELNLNLNFHRVTGDTATADDDDADEAADCLRLWYILYVCDQHLATIYGRPPIVQEDLSLNRCETFLRCPAATATDARLVSQVRLLLVLNKVRSFFGPYTGSPIPQDCLAQLVDFDYQLDQWFAKWSGWIRDQQEKLGGFPRKGVSLHMHFARLYLYSHVYRGLGAAPVPPVFRDLASRAVTEATSIIDMLLHDRDIIDGLRGVPSYLHSMTAFACMFLVSVSTRRSAGDDTHAPPPPIDPARVEDLIARLVRLFRSTPTGRWHLVHLMAGGLDKVLAKMRSRRPHQGPASSHATSVPAPAAAPTLTGMPSSNHNIMSSPLSSATAAAATASGGEDAGDGGGLFDVSSSAAGYDGGGGGGGGINWIDWAAETQLGGGLDGGPLFDMNLGFSPLLPLDPSILDLGTGRDGW